MEKQKFYLIFIIVLLFIGVYSYKIGNIGIIFKKEISQEENNMLTEAKMTYNDEDRDGNGNDIVSKKDFEQQSSSTDAKKITVNQPTALSGKSKAEIYKLRKDYVSQSIFVKSNYEPSEEVFGGIVGGKPWISANVCIDSQTGKLRTTGPSEESRFINNPTMLVAIEYPYPVRYNDAKTCTSSNSEMIPTSIKYVPSKKMIIVKYYNLPFTTNNNPSFYMFNGVNARDLGYKYAYLDKKKSTYDVDFISSDNLSTGIQEFQNFIHLGGSCGHEGGCNNGSPRQHFLEFKSNATSYNYENRYIQIKLWKNKPKSPEAPADITERIILRWS